ncbi:hypothetical protein EDEG_02723 [Edhazardia aedis USNM 41457]|uniref:UBC core domain-containing protein n=1 Tax=Edhazardia aedis (strain USNM 41457) TaxID=1003232 RepID=J9D5S2_EDHAE|nr:hypothetical protein EDEG_02723 [Edhazardia aedis USNM 41457]|eukprot:EJW02899.1 hypothetical protein EDEG_02723 [Edhazardia aedis USNM 41457]
MPVFADYRIEKELETLDLLPKSTIKKIQPTEQRFYTAFEFSVYINEGLYSPKKYVFNINLFKEYPFRPPKILCKTPIFHPNIDKEGHVCLNIIREDWSSAYGLQTIILGVYSLFFEFDGENALNLDAGEMFTNNYNEFIKTVNEYLKK